MRAIQGFRPDAVTWSVLALAAAALAMRLVDLDARPMHHDESLHATFAWYFAEGRGYLHDPLMHGPLQFHVLAGAFRLFGESEVISRFPSALAGAALVAAPLLLRRRLGTTGVVVAAALLALSPVLLYYSRFARNDLPFALFTTLFAAAVWRYREQRGHGDGETPADGERRIRGGGWLLLAAAALALSFTTKETTPPSRGGSSPSGSRGGGACSAGPRSCRRRGRWSRSGRSPGRCAGGGGSARGAQTATCSSWWGL